MNIFQKRSIQMFDKVLNTPLRLFQNILHYTTHPNIIIRFVIRIQSKLKFQIASKRVNYLKMYLNLLRHIRKRTGQEHLYWNEITWVIAAKIQAKRNRLCKNYNRKINPR